jgi:hypothetical protein
MIVIIGTVTADSLLQSQRPMAALGGDGFRQSNLVFTDAPLTISMGATAATIEAIPGALFKRPMP